jgi:PAS domain S-box-containing protein
MSNADEAAEDPAGARAELLAAHDIGGLTDDPRLKRITDFAATLCDTPIALVSIVETERQWFPARTGLDVRETPRATSFCAHAMLRDDVMIVEDASKDPRFADNPLVTGEPHIRFYAGAPLVSSEGVPLGALCVIDQAPRDGLTDLQRDGLTLLATSVISLLTLRRSERQANRELDEQEAKFRILADTMPQMVWSTLPDGYHDYYNARWYEFTGVPAGSTDGEAWNGMFHPDDRERAWSVWRHSLRTGDPYEIEYRLRNAAGDYRWTLGRALPIRDREDAIVRWFGTCTDIHDSRLLHEQREVITHELSHRIKNIFSVIGGLVTLTTRHNPLLTDVAADLRDRIVSLGRAHDFVRPHSEASRPSMRQSSLFGMLEQLLSPYRSENEKRIQIVGEDLEIDDRSATPLALLFHELATNAAKYGALSKPEGMVTIQAAAGDDGLIELIWKESGGPAVAMPEKEGFGSKLIELSVARQMGGQIYREWRPGGLLAKLVIPATAMNRAN